MGQCGAHLHERILSASVRSQVADLWMIWLRMFRVCGCLTCETADSTCNPMISRLTPCFIFLPVAFLLLPPFPGCSLFPFLLSSCWKTSLIFPSSHALWHLDREVQNCLGFFFLERLDFVSYVTMKHDKHSTCWTFLANRKFELQYRGWPLVAVLSVSMFVVIPVFWFRAR